MVGRKKQICIDDDVDGDNEDAISSNCETFLREENSCSNPLDSGLHQMDNLELKIAKLGKSEL